MTPEERKRMDDLEAAVERLDLLVARITRKHGLEEPAAKPGRWLEQARYANACSGACKGRVEQGERCWYVPKSATSKALIYHEACAPAEAKAKTNGKAQAPA